MKKTLIDLYFKRIPYYFYIIPTLIIWYRKDLFLETGVYTPGCGVVIKFLKWSIGIQFQKGY
jgi:hypothetical protein